MIPLSVLDLSPIVEGGDAAAALRNTLDLARHAERWGYRRYWQADTTRNRTPAMASAGGPEARDADFQRPDDN